MAGNPQPGDVCLIGDMAAKRARIAAPLGFQRIRRLLEANNAAALSVRRQLTLGNSEQPVVEVDAA